MDRIIALVDMDCFYCQVEERLDPSLKGKPVAVVQYNAWKGGGILAVNYEAREKGVKRHMRGDEAKKSCPEIQLVKVPDVRGKADLTKYRDAGREVAVVLNEFCELVERASVDEAYLDLTSIVKKSIIDNSVEISEEHLRNTFVVGYESSDNGNAADGIKQWLKDIKQHEFSSSDLIKLSHAGKIVEEIRSAVFEKTGFHCSAGIAHNKILAKLVCGLHKPNRQTILPHSSVEILFKDMPIKKVRNLGGKFGDIVLEQLGCTYMADLLKYSLNYLQRQFDDKSGLWLYNIARGIDLEPVKARMISKSIGCSKNFPAHTALSTKQDVQYWITELAGEFSDRLQDDRAINKRRGCLLTVNWLQETSNRKTGASSRSVPLPSYDCEKIVQLAIAALKKYNSAPTSSEYWSPPIKHLGMSVSKFTNLLDPNKSIEKFLKSDWSLVDSEDKSIINGDSSGLEYNTSISDVNECSNVDYSNSFFIKFFKEQTRPRLDLMENNFKNNLSAIQEAMNKNREDEIEIRNDKTYIHVGEIKTDTENSTVIDEEKIYFTVDEDEFDCSDDNSNLSFHEENLNNTILNTTCVVTNSNEGRSISPLTETCPYCKSSISLFNYSEHLDHHMALNLQEAFNNDETNDAFETNECKTSSKRKRVDETTTPSPTKKPCTVSSFFRKIN